MCAVSACTCCASVCPDVSVMFYNDRFTPSRDSTNVHTLRLLSPFPLRLIQILYFLFNPPGVSRWQALWRCESVCLPLTLVTRILSGVIHTDCVEIELGVKGPLCVLVCNVYRHTVCKWVCVCVFKSLCSSVQMAQLPVFNFASKNQTTPLHTHIQNKYRHMEGSSLIHYKQPPSAPFLNSTQHKVMTQRGINEEVSTKNIIRGQHMSSQCTTPHKTTVPTKQIGFLLQLTVWCVVQLCVYACDAL